MKRPLVISLIVLAGIAFSGCSDEARYRRYVRASVRAKEKRQKAWRKEMAKQHREQLEAMQGEEPLPYSVTVQ